MTGERLDFEKQGFALLPGFLAPAELAELQGALERYIRDVVPRLPPADAFYLDRDRTESLKQLQHMRRDPFFLEFVRRPRILALGRDLLGEEVFPHEPEWFNKPPGYPSPTPPHQDNYYFCLRPPQVLTLWIALDPVDQGNGCLRYVPGSHRRGLRPHAASRILGFSQGISDYGEADRAAETAIRLQPGDAVVHHGETIHRADANASADRHRRAFAVVLQGESSARDEAAFTRYQLALEQQHRDFGLDDASHR